MIDRRTLLQSATGLAIAGLTRRTVGAAAGDKPTADMQLQALLQRHSEAYLRRSPEDATRYDFDTGVNAALRSQLDDRSLDARARDHTSVDRAMRELSSIDRSALSPGAAVDYDVAAFVYKTLGDQLSRYGYVDINLRPSPYVVSQMNGAYYWLPEFIGTNHPLESKQDVDAYLARLNALGTALDQETARITHDAGLGVVLPNFTLEKTIAQIRGLRDSPPAQSALIGPAVERALKRGLGDINVRAEAVFKQIVVPALSRQSAALEALRPKAVDKAGVWHLPDGEAYYASAVHSNTTSNIAIPELHQLGLQQVADISKQLDKGLRAFGYTQGLVGERIKALNRDARFLAPENDQGREQLIDAARQMLARISAQLPKAFKTIPSGSLEVRRVPIAIENGAPGAFYSEGVGGAPGIYSLNLKSPADLPLWRLPTLTHHEGIPGHHFQYSVLNAAGGVSLFRRIVRFSAYTEGWALYAERLADELGVYENDPVGRIGLLQSELFRAARIVVDTGIHYRRWTRQQATKWMVDNAGEPQGTAEREIDRYCVYPGQACSFMVGRNEILAARERVRAAMGTRFDVRDFHELVLRSGPVPLQVLGQYPGSFRR
ncbi:MAG: DUF885 family protein [Gammaproteobacteria bacterium]